jgi:uncharacterized repeat protein (TIGR01451 family)
MTSKLKLLVACSSVPLAMLCAAPAFAAGTTQATPITNTVTVNYNVGLVPQTQQTATDTFVVDRKILFTLAELGSVTTTANPGQTAAVTAFVLTNSSNDTLDFVLTPSQIVGGTAAHGGTDAFNVTNLLVCRDANNDLACDTAATATLTVDNLIPDTPARFLIVGDIPSGATNGQIAGVTLSAQARNSADGSVITPATDATANGAATVETIFADAAKSGNGGTSAARDGIDVATDDYTVSAAVLSVFKSSRVISDGVSASAFKSIPGAVVEYCISVANASGGATATNINISDLVPTNMIYIANSIRINTTVTNVGTAAQTCGTGAAGGSFASNTVSGTLSDIASGQSFGLAFQATIQ